MGTNMRLNIGRGELGPNDNKDNRDNATQSKPRAALLARYQAADERPGQSPQATTYGGDHDFRKVHFIPQYATELKG